MKGITFHAELDARRGSKSGCKRFWPFTRALLREWAEMGHKCAIVAVFQGSAHRCHDGSQEALVSTFDQEDSDVSLGSVSRVYLHKRTVRIDEALARRLHPRVFVRLDAND